MFSDLASSIRLGFATNSSSSHSILLLQNPKDVETLKGRGWKKAHRGEYGWDWFAISTRKEKLDYLWTNLYGQLRKPHRGLDTYAAHTASEILEHTPRNFGDSRYEYTGKRVKKVFDKTVFGEPYIDHDSTFSFPLDPETGGTPHVGFVRWFREMVLHPRVVVLGGNDNDETTPERPAGEHVRFLPDDEYAEPMQCYDRETHWLLFRPSDGFKLRIPKEVGAEIRSSPVPELVDVKVTDQCGAKCAFCYQGSTPKGANPKMGPSDMARTLKNLDVREVAIGGGEPLEWPGLWNFVGALKDSTVVNLTTRRPELIPFWKLSELGSVGYSVESAKVLEKTLKQLDLQAMGNPWQQKLVVHVVLGATPVEEVVKICQLAADFYLEVLLLAFKTDGRGAGFKPFPHDHWIDALKEAFWDEGWEGPKLGVDTPTAERWGTELRKKLEVDPRLMSPGEGRFSMYVDFVSETFGKASYGGEERTGFQEAVHHTFAWDRPRHLGNLMLKTFRSWNP